MPHALATPTDMLAWPLLMILPLRTTKVCLRGRWVIRRSHGETRVCVTRSETNWVENMAVSLFSVFYTFIREKILRIYSEQFSIHGKWIRGTLIVEGLNTVMPWLGFRDSGHDYTMQHFVIISRTPRVTYHQSNPKYTFCTSLDTGSGRSPRSLGSDGMENNL